MTMRTNPFELLGLAPTDDVRAIKRAWFEALPKHPPHSDPEGFRALRDAYEGLMDDGRRAEALYVMPPPPEALRAALEAFAPGIAGRLDEARTVFHEAEAIRHADTRLLDWVCARTLAAAVASWPAPGHSDLSSR
jgi:curved DNA-binding protein CbpA